MLLWAVFPFIKGARSRTFWLSSGWSRQAAILSLFQGPSIYPGGDLGIRPWKNSGTMRRSPIYRSLPIARPSSMAICVSPVEITARQKEGMQEYIGIIRQLKGSGPKWLFKTLVESTIKATGYIGHLKEIRDI